MNYIVIDFKNYRFKRFPKIKIYVDDDLIEEVHFGQEEQTVSIPVALEDGKHILEIEHFDKTSRDTQIKDDTFTLSIWLELACQMKRAIYT